MAPLFFLYSKEVSLSKRTVTFVPKLEETKPSKEVSLSKRTVTFTPKSRHTFKRISRYISSHLRKYVWERDGGQCTYIHYEDAP